MSKNEGEFQEFDLSGEQMESITANQLEVINRSEIDIQIATAKRYPRSMTQFKNRAIEMATFDIETAQQCFYYRPVGQEKNPSTGKMEMVYAEGNSIRLAEIVACAYGNLRVGAIIVEQTEKKVTARGMAHDLETNLASTSEIVESTLKKNGTPYTPRMRVVIAKAALSKAWRDAVFKVVPRALAKPVAEAAKNLLNNPEDNKSLKKRRNHVVVWAEKVLKIDIQRVYSALGIEGIDDLGFDELNKLQGIRNAIEEGSVTPDEAFPVEITDEDKPGSENEKKSDDPLGEFNSLGKEKNEEKAVEPEPEKKTEDKTPEPTPTEEPKESSPAPPEPPEQEPVDSKPKEPEETIDTSAPEAAVEQTPPSEPETKPTEEKPSESVEIDPDAQISDERAIEISSLAKDMQVELTKRNDIIYDISGQKRPKQLTNAQADKVVAELKRIGSVNRDTPQNDEKSKGEQGRNDDLFTTPTPSQAHQERYMYFNTLIGNSDKIEDLELIETEYKKYKETPEADNFPINYDQLLCTAFNRKRADLRK